VRRDPEPLVARIAKAGAAPPDLVRAQLAAVSPLFGTRLEKTAIEEWARFDERLGIVERPLDINGSFRF
jgi:hypothetical protein